MDWELGTPSLGSHLERSKETSAKDMTLIGSVMRSDVDDKPQPEVFRPKLYSKSY